MNDNEIVRALECCTYNITQEKCDECPLYERGHCTTQLASNSLDLIKRQQAENERLSGELIIERTRRKNAVDAYHEAEAEIERLKGKRGD